MVRFRAPATLIISCCCIYTCSITEGALIASLPGGAQQVYSTSTFLYYGPQEPEVLGAPLLWVESQHICKLSKTKAAEIRGRVVMTRLLRTDCDLTELYTILERAEAAALAIQTFTGTPGLFSFLKTDWVGLPEGNMPFLDVERGFDAELFSGTLIDITAPHDTSFQDCFLSWPWLLVVRIFLPICACYSSFLGANVVYARLRHRAMSEGVSAHGSCVHQRLPVGSVIGFLNMVTNLIVAANLASGHFGPMHLPFNLHFAFYFLLSGSTLFSTVLLALLAREKTRTLNFLVERDIWAHYPVTLWLSAFLFLGCDVVFFCFMAVDHASNAAYSKFTLIMLSIPFYLAGNSAVGIYFFYQARALAAPLQRYVRHFEARIRSVKAKQILRLGFWINIAGASLLGSTIVLSPVLVVLMINFVGANEIFSGELSGNFIPLTWTVCIIAFAAFQIGTSYAQLQVVSNAQLKATQLLRKKCRSCVKRKTRNNAAVIPLGEYRRSGQHSAGSNRRRRSMSSRRSSRDKSFPPPTSLGRINEEGEEQGEAGGSGGYDAHGVWLQHPVLAPTQPGRWRRDGEGLSWIIDGSRVTTDLFLDHLSEEEQRLRPTNSQSREKTELRI